MNPVPALHAHPPCDDFWTIVLGEERGIVRSIDQG
jgi:hypothetical protein